MEDGSENARRRSAKRWIAFAIGLVAFCVVFPQCVEPDLVPPAAISIFLLWLASPFVAIAAGYGIAILTGERLGLVVFKALAIAGFLDIVLFAALFNVL